ncbi:MAG TPA: hypothetical protein VMU26_09780 [Candidatus Polarisedimenticolia bacterium]|nr:hypothetical protein [Candidatus Polarisedimenticolia bacterium]
MHVIPDAAVMLNDDACIQDAVVPNYCVRVDDNTGHYDGATPDASRGRHNRSRMDQRYQLKPSIYAFLKTPLPVTVVADSHD